MAILIFGIEMCGNTENKYSSKIKTFQAISGNILHHSTKLVLMHFSLVLCFACLSHHAVRHDNAIQIAIPH